MANNRIKGNSPMRTIKDFLTAFNGLRLPVGNLGVSRSQMPQIADGDRDAFIRFLDGKGVSAELDEVPVHTLSLTQAEINKLKVMKIMRSIRKSGVKTPIFVSEDNYVLDGSHRMVALLNVDKRGGMPVIRLDRPMKELLSIAKTFPKVRYRTHSDAKVG